MIEKTASLIALLLLCVCGAFAQYAPEQDLPLQVPENHFYPLRSLENTDLQAALSKKLNANPKWRKLIAQKKLAVGLVDLSNPYDVRFAQVNGDKMMYAASLPKIAVLLAAEDAIQKGELKETKEVLTDMRLMIAKSNNAATTRMIDRLGFEKIEEVVTNPRYGLYDEAHGGGLWVGKRYAASGRRYPDPLQGLSHAATATQVCRYYYMLAMGKLVSCERSEHMLEMMGEPELHHKFVNTLDRVAPRAELYRKSGSWRTYHSDSILVWGEGWRKYILVGLTDDPAGEQIMRELVLSVEDVLKKKPVLAQYGTPAIGGNRG